MIAAIKRRFSFSTSEPPLVRQPAGPDPFSGYSQTPEELKEAVHAWETGLEDTITYTNEGKLELAPGTCPGGPNAGKPFFQFLPLRKSFEDGGTMVCESTNCISFIPAGFRNASTPNTMNPVREEIGGTTALMSLVHVLTIPKDIRIYNAATLRKEHLPLLEEMEELGQKAVDILMKSGPDQLGSLEWVYQQSGDIHMNDRTTKSAEVVATDLDSTCRKNFKKKLTTYDTNHSFHMFPASSIGWLHLHSYVDQLRTTAYATMERECRSKGYNKNTPLSQIKLYLR